MHLHAPIELDSLQSRKHRARVRARQLAHDVHADLLARRRRRGGGPGDEYRGEDVLRHRDEPSIWGGPQCRRSAACAWAPAAAPQLPYLGRWWWLRFPRRRWAHQRRRQHGSRQRRRGAPIKHGIAACVQARGRRRCRPYRRELGGGQQLELEAHQLTN